jgi:hypothetical protein
MRNLFANLFGHLIGPNPTTEENFPKIEEYLAPPRLTERDSDTVAVKMVEALASELGRDRKM